MALAECSVLLSGATYWPIRTAQIALVKPCDLRRPTPNLYSNVRLSISDSALDGSALDVLIAQQVHSAPIDRLHN